MTIDNRPYNPVTYIPYDINNDGGEYTKETFILEKILNAYGYAQDNLSGEELRKERARTAREAIQQFINKAENTEIGFDNLIHQNFYYLSCYTTIDELIEDVGRFYGDSLAIHKIEFRDVVRVVREFLLGEFL